MTDHGKLCIHCWKTARRFESDFCQSCATQWLRGVAKIDEDDQKAVGKEIRSFPGRRYFHGRLRGHGYMENYFNNTVKIKE